MARVPYVPQEELDPEYQDLVVSSLQPGEQLNVYSALGNNQEVLRGMREFLGALWTHSGLTDRRREVVILTVASETGSEYEWHQHVSIASGTDLETGEIAAIGRDDRTVFPEDERALISYTRAVARGRVTDELHEAASEYLDEDALVGAASTAAGYLALGRVIDALGVETEPGAQFVGWDPSG